MMNVVCRTELEYKILCGIIRAAEMFGGNFERGILPPYSPDIVVTFYYGSNEAAVDLKIGPYKAEVDRAARLVKIGCQTFAFDKIKELNEHITDNTTV